jgi:pimeloyl-ACP methyl ester carboxylesterase
MDLPLPEGPTKTLARPGGVTIAYNVLGEGERTLMLANGLGGRLYAWEPLIRALPPGYKVITWDYRGLFDSTPPRGAVTSRCPTTPKTPSRCSTPRA